MKRIILTIFICIFISAFFSGCSYSTTEKLESKTESGIIVTSENENGESPVSQSQQGSVESITEVTKESDETKSVVEASTSSTAATEEENIKQESKEVEASSSQNDNKDYSKIGFKLEQQEARFILDNVFLDKDVIKKLGEPEEKSEALVWGADGLEHQTWYYKAKGIELDFIRDEDNNQTVKSIRISSPCSLKTSRNIGIDSTKKEVLDAYKNEINQEDSSKDLSSIVAGTVYGGVIFHLENDRVSSFFVGAAAE
jgi:hypothetical protein